MRRVGGEIIERVEKKRPGIEKGAEGRPLFKFSLPVGLADLFIAGKLRKKMLYVNSNNLVFGLDFTKEKDRALGRGQV